MAKIAKKEKKKKVRKAQRFSWYNISLTTIAYCNEIWMQWHMKGTAHDPLHDDVHLNRK